MPDVTVSGNVDTMMRAANNAAIRSAIGLGQTDVPTFAGLNSTGIIGNGVFGILPSSSGISYYDSQSTFRIRNAAGGYTQMFNLLPSGEITLGPTAASVTLAPDAAGILAQRNVGSTQQFRLYNTTDAGNVNYERLELKLASGAFRIETARGGTGFRRSLILSVEGSPYFALSGSADASLAWWSIIASTGSLVCNLDNTYDIGASGANRPKNIYVGTSIFTGVGGINFDVNARIRSPADSIVTLYNSALTDFGRLQLGGTTSAFPAIKRNGTGIDIVLANDSGFAPIKGKLTTDTAYAAGVPSATGYITIYDATGTAYRVPCTV